MVVVVRFAGGLGARDGEVWLWYMRRVWDSRFVSRALKELDVDMSLQIE